MLSNRRSAEGETAACKEDVQWKILHYKLCGRGLAANQRLQFCGWRGSLASIHELTRTENFRIRTPPLSVAGLVIFTKVAKIGGFFKFTAQGTPRPVREKNWQLFRPLPGNWISKFRGKSIFIRVTGNRCSEKTLTGCAGVPPISGPKFIPLGWRLEYFSEY